MWGGSEGARLVLPLQDLDTTFTEAKRDETKQDETKRSETSRNESKRSEIKMKRVETKAKRMRYTRSDLADSWRQRATIPDKLALYQDSKLAEMRRERGILLSRSKLG